MLIRFVVGSTEEEDNAVREEHVIGSFGWIIGLSLLGGISYYLTYHYSNLLKKPFLVVVWIVSSLSTVLWLLFNFCFFDILKPSWLVSIRAVWGIEFSIFFVGMFCGLVQESINRKKQPKGPFSKHNGLILLFLFIVPSFVQPILFPYEDNFVDEWKDGVCLQSNGYSCGPASVATILNRYGIRKTEKEVSRDVYLSSQGSKAWYLIRYLRKNGLKARVVSIPEKPEDPPVPCLAGVRLSNGILHSTVLLDKTDSTFIIGDPQSGRFEWSKEKTFDDYEFLGYLVHITAP